MCGKKKSSGGYARPLRVCALAAALPQPVRVVVVDTDATVVKLARQQGAEARRGDVVAVAQTFLDAHFGGIYLDVTHGSVEKLLGQVAGVRHCLRPGGVLAVTLLGRCSTGGSLAHRSLELTRRLEEQGFAVTLEGLRPAPARPVFSIVLRLAT